MKFRFCGDLDCPDWVLAEVSTLSQMSSVRIRVLVAQILSYCLVGDLNYEKILKLAADNAEGISDLKGAVAAVHYLITNAAKYDVADLDFVQEMLQLGLPKENTDAIAKYYRENKESLRNKFADDSYRVSKLLDTSWRTDHIIATSSTTESTIPVSNILIHLKLQIDTKPELGITPIGQISDGERIKDVAFELTAEKLDLLIYELSAAEKLLNNA